MYLGIPYSVDMGCSATGGQDKGSGRKCGNGNLKPTAHQWELALPLYLPVVPLYLCRDPLHTRSTNARPILPPGYAP